VIIDEGEGVGGSGPGSAVSTADSVTPAQGPMVASATAVSASTGGGCIGTGAGGNVFQETVCPDGLSQPCPSAGEATPVIASYLGFCDCLLSVDGGPSINPNGSCCYDVTVEVICVEGRPFLVDRETITARAEGGARGWIDEALTPDTKDLSAAACEALADRWTRNALFEHASIASFGRFALDLLAAGAPAHLIEAAHAAAIDEVGHASMAFAMASAYRGEPVGPSAFPIGGAVTVSGDLKSLAVSTAIEGCIGETLAAVMAAEELARATDPAVRRALALIAEEEASHAELAWRAVSWAMSMGGDAVREAVEAVFSGAARHVPTVPSDDPSLAPFTSMLAAHGRLDRATARAALVKGLDEVVLPCARALLMPAPRASASPCTMGGYARVHEV